MAEEQKPTLTQVTPEELERLLRGETVELSLEKNTIESIVDFDETYYSICATNFEVGNLRLEGQYPYEIRIKGHTMMRTFSVREKAKLGDLWILDHVKISSGIWISGDTEIENLVISDNSYVKNINIYEKAKVGNIWIHGKSIIGPININDDASIGQIIASRNAEIGHITVSQKSKLNHLSISGRVITNSINISDDVILDKIGFYDNVVMNDISIKDSVKIREIEITGEPSINDFFINGNVYLEKLNFYGGNFNGRLELSNLTTNILSISGFPLLKNKLVFNSINLNKLTFDDFYLTNLIQITNINVNDKSSPSFVEFTRSSFSQLELIGNSFSSFDYQIFENSNITNTFIAGTDFPEEIKTRLGNENDEPYSNSEQAKLFYEQIKTAYLNQGNTTKALEYRAKELEEHYKDLTFKENTWEVITLWFNKVTNNHGTSWTKGVRLFFLFTIPLYLFILLLTDQVHLINPITMDWGQYWKDLDNYIANYFDFINPTSNIFKDWDYIFLLENKQISWYIKGLLFINKLFIVTVIYQIVQAFRKFGRR